LATFELILLYCQRQHLTKYYPIARFEAPFTKRTSEAVDMIGVTKSSENFSLDIFLTTVTAHSVQASEVIQAVTTVVLGEETV